MSSNANQSVSVTDHKRFKKLWIKKPSDQEDEPDQQAQAPVIPDSCLYGSDIYLPDDRPLPDLLNAIPEDDLPVCRPFSECNEDIPEASVVLDAIIRAQNTRPQVVHKKWTPDEVKIFETKYNTLVSYREKKFALIARGLPNKSIGDCVEFYYLYKNVLQFKHAERERKRKEKERREAIARSYEPCTSRLRSGRPCSSRAVTFKDPRGVGVAKASSTVTNGAEKTPRDAPSIPSTPSKEIPAVSPQDVLPVRPVSPIIDVEELTSESPLVLLQGVSMQACEARATGRKRKLATSVDDTNAHQPKKAKGIADQTPSKQHVDVKQRLVGQKRKRVDDDCKAAATKIKVISQDSGSTTLRRLQRKREIYQAEVCTASVLKTRGGRCVKVPRKLSI
ncbi:uncharacterized protein LOC116601522 [Nematostella vectensis]|uniref:uncharacterized protein LOC116601522 n=1 Tax=Nematostella vectensis TaxID=45351 RepID=UPI0013905BA6|nr:uncharacterized protein LOC116601522 [Nematostella vectensis]